MIEAAEKAGKIKPGGNVIEGRSGTRQWDWRWRQASRTTEEFRLACRRNAVENNGMMIKGRVQDGVIVLEGGAALPEGAEVVVSCKVESSTQPAIGKRIEFPLVHSKHPGTLRLTGQRVAELLEEEDVSS